MTETRPAKHPEIPPAAQARVRSVEGELVQDREVEDPTEDRFDHRQIADQLANLSLSVPDPSNIALYGPWGSGKSGIGNLVQKQLAQSRDVRFARFDAFKYAENPLRRNFVSAVAAALDIHDDEFHGDLYAGRTTTDFAVPATRLARLAATFLSLAFVICLGLLAIVAGVAAIQNGPFGDDFRTMSKQVINAALAPAALLSALVALAGRSLGVERKIDKAESDEQFEKVFSRLIRRANKHRIVLFVDELDRCAPADVVATLDAVRTFLGVRGCVFVVAADRQVLEEALTTDARQATPSDAVNPYYSAGSAYLDKVFQYQLIVPPLLQHSVTRFALELVRSRPGIWKELGPDLDLTVSILVPSHVRSPRRVKNLLNAFVLSYRLAEARQAAGLLATDVKERADEIARLVCFQVEFPLFARRLVMDARLPEYVLRLRNDGSDAVWMDFPHTSHDVRQVAEDFAGLRLPVATLLSEQESDQRDEGEREDSGTRDRPVEQQHGRQLLEYLSRTRTVLGPGRDLLHLQSTGSVVGLDAQLAERIERSAADGDIRSILPTLAELDSEGKQGVLSLLIEQSRAAIGLEAQNVAATLLAIGGISGLDLEARADAVADVLAPAVEAFPELLGSSGLAGAWRIGLAAHRSAGRQLLVQVLDHPGLLSDNAIARQVIRSASSALEASSEKTSELVTSHLISDHAAETADEIGDLDAESASRLLREARQHLISSLQALLAEAPAASASASTRPGSLVATAEQGDPEPVLEALGDLLLRLQRGPDGPAQELVSLLLTVDDRRIRDLVEPHIALTGPVEDPEFGAQILKACARRSVSLWPRWLGSLTSAATAEGGADEPLSKLIERLWHSATQEEDRPSGDHLVEASAALLKVLEYRPGDRGPSVADAVRASLADYVADSESARARLELHEAAEPLLAAGILPPIVLVEREAESLISTLQEDLPEQDPDGDLANYVTRTAIGAIAGWPGSGPDSELPSASTVADLLIALHECTWLPEPHATGLPLIARVAAANVDQSQLPPLVPASVIAALSDEHGSAATHAVVAWMSIADPSATELESLVPRLIADHPPSEVLSALLTQTTKLDSKARVALLGSLLNDPNAAVPGSAVLAAIGITVTPDMEVARLIVQRFEKCGNNAQRRHVLELWERCDLSAEAARRYLVERVLIPLFNLNVERGNSQAAEIGLDFLTRLAQPPPAGTKKALGDAVMEATHGHNGEGRAVDALKSLGYKATRKGSIFRRRTEVDTGTSED